MQYHPCSESSYSLTILLVLLQDLTPLFVNFWCGWLFYFYNRCKSEVGATVLLAIKGACEQAQELNRKGIQ
jgi:hypothetical protein